MIRPCRSAICRTTLAVLLATAGLAAGATPRAAEAALAADSLLQPTPLILKDGRIAEVSVHVVPFAAGGAEIAPPAAGDLADLTQQVATDCFLTAQVIGHVGPSEVAENDSLAAHRLARSRADAVQASLIGRGLPAKSIASVWDWQFMVPEARATLWLFRLSEGEDCDGTPLPGASEMIAGHETGAASAPPASTPQASDAAAPADQAESAPADRGSPSSSRQEVAAARPAPQRAADRAPASTPPAGQRTAPAAPKDAAKDAADAGRPEPTAVPAGPATAKSDPQPETREVPATSLDRTAASEPPQKSAAEQAKIARATPATTPTPPSRRRAATVWPAAPSQAAKGEAPKDEAATEDAAGSQGGQRQARADATAAMATGDGLAITFATNSSYFPPGTSRQLRSLVRGMTAGERYRIVLQAGVSGSDKVAGASTPEEARRYNRWLAERRVERVQTWLSENAAGVDLVIEPDYVVGNEERTVVVRIAPAA